MTHHEALANTSHRAKLTVSDFLALADLGAFDRYAKSELIEGEIWVVNAVHRRHAQVHAMLTVELGLALRKSASSLVLYANPSTELSDHSLPEPDIAIAEADKGKIVMGPTVRLAVEISDSTLDVDLGRKAQLYAGHGVPEYWVADVERAVIHQMWAPTGDGYAERREIRFADGVTAATIDGLAVGPLAV